MAKRKYPDQPDTLDPTDWLMYCDILQEANAPPARWRWAKRVGDSLQAEPGLFLLDVDGRYMPRVVRSPSMMPLLPQTGTGMPALVKRCHLKHLRYHESRSVYTEASDVFSDHIESCGCFLDLTRDDCFMMEGFALALWKYACQTWGEPRMRREYIETHGRLGLYYEFDARRKWHV